VFKLCSNYSFVLMHWNNIIIFVKHIKKVPKQILPDIFLTRQKCIVCFQIKVFFNVNFYILSINKITVITTKIITVMVISNILTFWYYAYFRIVNMYLFYVKYRKRKTFT